MVAGFATFICVGIVADGNYCWSAFGFTMMTSSLSAGALLLAVVPSWFRYAKTRQPNDWTTLQMAGFSFLALVAEAIALQILPQRGE